MPNLSFYDKLDLKYPEIGIAIEEIYCPNPGKIKVVIPILTPEAASAGESEETIIQRSGGNLLNSSKNGTVFEVSDVIKRNYLEIKFPREICMPDDQLTRVIWKGSKWIIVFLGGDITKPYPIARYYET